MSQPGHCWYSIWDENIDKNLLEKPMMHKARPVVGNTLEELCEKLGIDKAGTRATIDRYNKNVKELGQDPEFERTTQCGCDGVPVALENPPFYGLKCTGSTSSFKGGIKVNGKMQVINMYGEAIPNLYGAGEFVGGLWGYGGTYLPCTMVSSGFTLGRLAGKLADKETPWKG